MGIMSEIQWFILLVHFQTWAFSLFPEMCFGPESSKYDEQKLCREPSLIQDKQGFDYKYDSGRSLASRQPHLFAQTADSFSIQNCTV